MVTWDEIPGLDQNGIIINYEIQIESLEFPADIVSPLITASLSIAVTGLEEYVSYNISVRAYTSLGPGPYSDPVTKRTLEDGNVPIPCFWMCFHNVNISCLTPSASHISSECPRHNHLLY